MEYLVPSATSKSKFLISAIITPLIAFFSPVSPLVSAILWLVLLDVLTGIYAARVVEKKPVISRSFLRKFPQVILFIIGVSAALHADPFFTEFGIEKYQAVKLIIAFYGIYELFSVLENLGRAGLPVAKNITNLLQNKIPVELKNELDKKE